MEEEDVFTLIDADGQEVKLPFEAIEQLYGELGLSPGIGSTTINDRGCTCAIGVLEAAGLKNHKTQSGFPSIWGTSFDVGARSGYKRSVSERLGAYFRNRLPSGAELPNVCNSDLS